MCSAKFNPAAVRFFGNHLKGCVWLVWLLSVVNTTAQTYGEVEVKGGEKRITLNCYGEVRDKGMLQRMSIVHFCALD